MAVLRYGADSSLCLETANGVPLDERGVPQGRPLDDLGSAVPAALAAPIEYPPLAQNTTPGDRVVLALDRGIPQAAQITAAVIGALAEVGVDPDGITVLRTQVDISAGTDDPCRLLDKDSSDRITRLVHDPADRRQLAYLAANDAGEPILVNRAIHEADLVLPIGCLHRETAAGYFGIHGAIFPAFSDQNTLARFRCLRTLNRHSHRRRELTGEVDHVAWLLGVNFSIQVVPAAGEGVLHVVAGHSDAVRRRGRTLYRSAWRGPAVRRASLVVAAIEGGAGQQTWENLGRALSAATSLAEDGGAVAVCCDLAALPGPAVQQMAGRQSRRKVLRRIGRSLPDDAFPAAQLARALDHGRVYLLSQLAPSLVEELDVTPIAGGDELSRLMRQHKSCILLANAPYAIVSADDE